MPSPSDDCSDPFREAREQEGVLVTRFQGQPVPMLLRHRDVRAAAGNWKTFSNDAPFRVPIPSEEKVRSVRQLPIETDPPEHTEYRAIAEPFFRQPKDPSFVAKIRMLVDELLNLSRSNGEIEIVRQFALPLQSRALTYLLRVPESEAQEWILWGTHVFRDGDDGEPKGAALDRYIQRQFDRAINNPADDFFSALTQAQFRGRPLTREEMTGFANLAFAGGRDTVIQMIAAIVGHLGKHANLLGQLRDNPALITTAAEEFFRYVSPLTHIGRVCPHNTEVKGVAVEANERVSLCWASANRDSTVFDSPNEVRLDRRPNPHLAFGSGPHNCIGALHSRLIVRTLLERLSVRVRSIEIVQETPQVESEADYVRRNGYDALVARFNFAD